jgi:hypothetical protein
MCRLDASGQVASCWEDGNETLGSIKGVIFL